MARLMAGSLVRYMGGLTTPRLVLWCYLLWYVVVAAAHFDSSPRLWITSFGLSVIIGVALILNARIGLPAGSRVDRWQAFRFFMMPFCVSSFSALVKGQGFLLVFSPRGTEVAACLGVCLAFLGAARLCRAWMGSRRLSLV